MVEAIRRNKKAYFCAVGGAGALMASHIVKAEEIAFPDLGCESVKALTIEELPLITAIDSTGESIFDTGRRAYALRGR